MRWPWQRKPSEEGDGGVRFFTVLQGVGFAFAAALALALILGLVTAWSTAWAPSDGLLRALNLLVVAAGGFYGGRRTKRLGWLHGGLTGLVYVVLVSWMMAPQFGLSMFLSGPWLLETLYAFLSGAAGGVAGVAV